jgi:hypothetical protein
MSSPSDLPDSKAGGWAPELPLTVPAPLMWPPQPLKLLKYLFGFPGLFFPWLSLYAGIAVALWALIRALGADLTHLSVGWIKDLERLARLRIQPFSADQQLTLGREKASRQLLSHQ